MYNEISALVKLVVNEKSNFIVSSNSANGAWRLFHQVHYGIIHISEFSLAE